MDYPEVNLKINVVPLKVSEEKFSGECIPDGLGFHFWRKRTWKNWLPRLFYRIKTKLNLFPM